MIFKYRFQHYYILPSTHDEAALLEKKKKPKPNTVSV